MAETVLDVNNHASKWSIALSITMIVLGIIAMLVPWWFGLTIALVVGVSAIFSGVAQITYGFCTYGSRRTALEAILGLIYVAAGSYIVWHPGRGGLLALTLLLASSLILYGIFALLLAFDMPPEGGRGWVLFDAIITILLGILIRVHWPSMEWVVGVLYGLSVLMSGLTRLMMSLPRKMSSYHTHETGSVDRYCEMQDRLSEYAAGPSRKRIELLTAQLEAQLKLEDFLLRFREAEHAKVKVWGTIFVPALVSFLVSLVSILVAHHYKK